MPSTQPTTSAGDTGVPTDSNLTILHVTAPAEFGGLERVVHALSAGHVRRGHRVHVIAVTESDAAEHRFLASLTDSRVRVHQVTIPTRAYLRERRSVATILRDVEPDVVHTHGYRADLVDRSVAGGLGFATVSTVHGFTGGGWKNRLYERLQVASFRRFDAVVAVSTPLGRRLRAAGVRDDRLHVVQNAWPGEGDRCDRATARKRLGIELDRFQVGWVGRLTREKGADVLVDALQYLEDLPIHVSFIGDGAESPRLSAQGGRWAERITWHGSVPDAARVLEAFDVFVLSSRTEGTPIVLLEAIAAGVPVVASSVGGVPDVVTDVTASLVDPDDPRTLARAIRGVFTDRELARERAQKAKECLERDFALEPWLDRYESIYRAIRRPRRAPAA